MKHVDELRSIEDEHSLDLSREVRAARGQFFTPEVVGRRMAKELAAALRAGNPAELRVVDPFCGDGRLLIWFLEAWQDRKVPITVEAWDTDASLVAGTSDRLRSAMESLGQAGRVKVNAGDSFDEAVRYWGLFDGVITNPPWEAIKPDRRHLQALPEQRKSTYIEQLREFDRRLAATYPEAQPSRKFAGWGTNLSRVGMAAAHRLVRTGGYMSIVMPGSVVADTSHAALRSAVTADSSLIEVCSYPAEARLFGRVDVHFVTLSLRKERVRAKVGLVQFDASSRIASRMTAPQPATGEAEWLFPLHAGAMPSAAFARLSELPTLGDLLANSGFWAGRELDETGLARHFRPQGVPVLKGRNIRRFGHEYEHGMVVDPDLAAKYPTTGRPRLVWRDVSRPSQRRRVHATVIPPDSLTGNSLGVLTAPDDDDQLLMWMLGLFSSAVFEAQLRTLLTTGHVTLASLRKVRVPLPEGPHFEEVAELAASQLASEMPETQRALELAVCSAYGLRRTERDELFASYEWLPQTTRPFEIGAAA